MVRACSTYGNGNNIYKSSWGKFKQFLEGMETDRICEWILKNRTRVGFIWLRIGIIYGLR